MEKKQSLLLVLILTFSSFVLFWSLAFLPRLFNFNNSDLNYLSAFFNYQPSFEASFYYLSGLGLILAMMIVGYFLIDIINWKAKKEVFSHIKIKESWLWIGYLASVIFGLVAYFQVGGLPLLDMPLRWETDPKFMFITFWQFVFISGLIVFRHKNNKSLVPIYIVFFLSLIYISLLSGSRHCPLRASLLISITTLFISKDK